MYLAKKLNTKKYIRTFVREISYLAIHRFPNYINQFFFMMNRFQCIFLVLMLQIKICNLNNEDDYISRAFYTLSKIFTLQDPREMPRAIWYEIAQFWTILFFLSFLALLLFRNFSKNVAKTFRLIFTFFACLNESFTYIWVLSTMLNTFYTWNENDAAKILIGISTGLLTIATFVVANSGYYIMTKPNIYAPRENRMRIYELFNKIGLLVLSTIIRNQTAMTWICVIFLFISCFTRGPSAGLLTPYLSFEPARVLRTMIWQELAMMIYCIVLGITGAENISNIVYVDLAMILPTYYWGMALLLERLITLYNRPHNKISDPIDYFHKILAIDFMRRNLNTSFDSFEKKLKNPYLVYMLSKYRNLKLSENESENNFSGYLGSNHALRKVLDFEFENLLELGLTKFKNSVDIQLFLVAQLIAFHGQIMRAYVLLLTMKDKITSQSQQGVYNLLQYKILKKIQNNSLDTIGVNFLPIKFISEYYQLSDMLMKELHKYSKDYFEFWKNYCEKDLHMQKIKEKSLEFESRAHDISEIWGDLYNDYLDHISDLIPYYAYYLELIRNCPFTAKMIEKLIFQKKFTHRDFQSYDITINNVYESKNIQIRVGYNTHKVYHCSKNIFSILGFTQQEMEGKEFTKLIPEFIASQHVDLMKRAEDYKNRVPILQKTTFCLTKQGHAVYCNVYIAIAPTYSDEVNFLAIIRPRLTTDKFLLVQDNAQIDAYSETVFELLRIPEIGKMNLHEFFRINHFFHIVKSTSDSPNTSGSLTSPMKKSQQNFNKLFSFLKSGMSLNMQGVRKDTGNCNFYFELTNIPINGKSYYKIDIIDAFMKELDIPDNDIDRETSEIPTDPEPVEAIDFLTDREIIMKGLQVLNLMSPDPENSSPRSNLSKSSARKNKFKIKKNKFSRFKKYASSDDDNKNEEEFGIKLSPVEDDAIKVKEPGLERKESSQKKVSSDNNSKSNQSAFQNMEALIYNLYLDPSLRLLNVFGITFISVIIIILVIYLSVTLVMLDHIEVNQNILIQLIKLQRESTFISRTLITFELLDRNFWRDNRYENYDLPDLATYIIPTLQKATTLEKETFNALSVKIGEYNSDVVETIIDKELIIYRNDGIPDQKRDLVNAFANLYELAYKISKTDITELNMNNSEIKIILNNSYNDILTLNSQTQIDISNINNDLLMWNIDLIAWFTYIIAGASVLLIFYAVNQFKRMITKRDEFNDCFRLLDIEKLRDHLFDVSRYIESFQDTNEKEDEPKEKLQAKIIRVKHHAKKNGEKVKKSTNLKGLNDIIYKFIGFIIIWIVIFFLPTIILQPIAQSSDQGLLDQIQFDRGVITFLYKIEVLLSSLYLYILSSSNIQVLNKPVKSVLDELINEFKSSNEFFLRLSENIQRNFDLEIYLNGDLCQIGLEVESEILICEKLSGGAYTKGIYSLNGQIVSSTLLTRNNFYDSNRDDNARNISLNLPELIEIETGLRLVGTPILRNLHEMIHELTSTRLSEMRGLTIEYCVTAMFLVTFFGMIGWIFIWQKIKQENFTWKKLYRIIPYQLILKNKLILSNLKCSSEEQYRIIDFSRIT